MFFWAEQDPEVAAPRIAAFKFSESGEFVHGVVREEIATLRSTV